MFSILCERLTPSYQPELAAMAIAIANFTASQGKLELFLLIAHIAIANFYINEYRNHRCSLTNIFNISRYIAGCLCLVFV